MSYLFKHLGFRDVVVTKKTGDGGVDLTVVSPQNSKVAIQCKRQKISNAVGVSAIQEVYTGKDYYNCDHAIVVTTSFFTKPAIEMATKLRVELWDRKRLMDENYKVRNVVSTWKEFLKDYYTMPGQRSNNEQYR